MTSAVPGVCMSATGQTVFVTTADGHLQALEASTGELLASRPSPGCPVATDGDQVVMIESPTSASLGRVTLIEMADGDLEQKWSADLLDREQHARLAAQLHQGNPHNADSGRFTVGFTPDLVVVDGSIPTYYNGGAPLDDPGLDAAARTDHFVRAYDRATGLPKSLPLPPQALESANGTNGANGNGSASGSDRRLLGATTSSIYPGHNPSIWLSNPAIAEWTITDPVGTNTSVRLDPGTDAVQVVDDRVIYRVLEPTPDGSGLRRYLRSRPIDDNSGAGQWSHLIDQTASAPPPPLPQ